MITKALPPANLICAIAQFLPKYYPGKLPRFLRPYRSTYHFVHDEVLITPAKISTV